MRLDMRTILLAAVSALVLSGSAANAAFLLGSDENDQKQVVNTDALTVQSGTYGARIAEPDADPVDRAFLLGSDENDGKRVVNQYAH
jgi:opacity protein-like surface antigen